MSNEIDEKVKGYLDRACKILGLEDCPIGFTEDETAIEIAKMIQLEEKYDDDSQRELKLNLKKWADFQLYRASKGENNE